MEWPTVWGSVPDLRLGAHWYSQRLLSVSQLHTTLTNMPPTPLSSPLRGCTPTHPDPHQTAQWGASLSVTNTPHTSYLIPLLTNLNSLALSVTSPCHTIRIQRSISG